MKFKKSIALMLSLLLVFSLAAEGMGPVFAASPDTEAAPETPARAETVKTSDDKLREILSNARPARAEEIDRESLDVDLTASEAAGNDMAEAIDEAMAESDELVRVIILMDEKSVVERDSGATPSAVTMTEAQRLERAQESVISAIESKVLEGGELKVAYQYTWLLNGIAAQVPYGKIREIEALEGVKKVLLQPVYSPLSSGGADSPMTNTEGGLIGRDEAWDAGYRGEGMKITVIDTGLDDDHPSFGPLPQELIDSYSGYMDAGDIEAVLTNLNSYKSYRGVLTAGSLYRTTKVAYGFNYVDNSLRIDHGGDNQGTHGTHVSGIAAANPLDTTDVVGVAPNAQLMVMKVFGANGGAYTEDLLAALEDAMLLGADVVNMSLGSPAGFTRNADEINEIYDRVNETGTILAISAGNSGAMGQGNLWGSGSNLTSNPDNSTVSSPATYAGALSVASSHKTMLRSYYLGFNGETYIYSDGVNGPNAPMLTLGGGSYGVAVVEGYGAELSEFTDAGAEGKIALVQRGGQVNFTTKCDNAEAAGAIACVIYNNEPSSMGIDMTGGSAAIPCVIISMSAGEAIKAALASDPGLELTVSSEMGTIPNEMAGQMSDFSSWGVSPDLKLEPDITAPGSGIYSTVDGGGYESMDGTSMASPNLAGLAALVKEYVLANYPGMSSTEVQSFVYALLMSTAEPLVYSGNGQYYSPRNQGAGLANAKLAISTGAVLGVPGMDVPKAELKDSADGTYSFSFTVKNFGGKALSYAVTASVETEDVVEGGYPGLEFMSLTPRGLTTQAHISGDLTYIYDYNSNGKINSHDAYLLYRMAEGTDPVPTGTGMRYDVLGDGEVERKDVQAYLDELVGKYVFDQDGEALNMGDAVLSVAPGAEMQLRVDLALNSADKSWMDAHFPNGIYVDGFVVLKSLDGGVDLSLPYMGFYGDWTKAPVIDSGYYWDPYFFGDNTGATPTASQYANILWTNYAGLSAQWMPGLNPYFGYEEDFDVSHISLSPNGDGSGDYIDDIYVSLLRNAKLLTFTWRDEEGNILHQDSIENVPKSFFNDSYGQVVPYVYSWDSVPYDLLLEDGSTFATGSKLTLDIEATLDYGDSMENNECYRWTTDVTVDTQAPVLLGEPMVSVLENGEQYLVISVSDEVSVAAVNFLNKRETMVLKQYAVDDAELGEATENGMVYRELVYDITGYGDEFTLVLGDYAFNESAYLITTTDNDPVLDENLLYGYRVHDDNYFTQYGEDQSLYGWVGLDPETAQVSVYDTEYFMDFALNAAEYVGGYILAADTASTLGGGDHLVWMRPGYWEDRVTITTLGIDMGYGPSGVGIADMALDPSTGTLYAVTGPSSYPTATLCTIDLTTGELKTVGEVNEWGMPASLGSVVAITCGPDGTLYGVDGEGALRTIDTETGLWNEDVLLDTAAVTGDVPNYTQSMTFDDDANAIYWAFYSEGDACGNLYRIDLENGAEMTLVGAMGEAGFAQPGRVEVVGLLRLDDRGYSLPEAALEGISFAEDSLSLVVGETGSFDVVSQPWYMAPRYLEWTSSDTSVATVGANGVIRAVGAGEATITAKTLDGAFSATGTVTVTQPSSTLYGFVGYSRDIMNQWVTFPAANLGDVAVLTEPAFSGYMAGEYVDGFVYAFDDSTGGLWRIDPVTFEGSRISDSLEGYATVYDMAYSCADGYLYALAATEYYSTDLLHVDTLTGELEYVCTLQQDCMVLGCSTEGQLYTIDSMEGIISTIDPETGAVTPVASGPSGVVPYGGSMAFDHSNGQAYLASMDGIYYISLESGKCVYLGAVDGGGVTCLFAPDYEAPPRPDVPVESVTMLKDRVKLMEGVTTGIPVLVKPFNATHRDVQWTVEDTTVALVENGSIIALKPGTTTVKGALAGFEVEFTVEVLASTGDVYGYVLGDLGGMGDHFWAKFSDTDPGAPGGGLADGSTYELYAGEYLDGKIYGFGYTYDPESWEAPAPLFIVVDAETYNADITAGKFPDIHDMAFDYTTGVMYAVGGTKNVSSNTLYMVDIATGDCYTVGKFEMGMAALTCDGAGQLYSISEDGDLYKVDKTDASLTLVGSTGYSALNAYQSMTYDYDTGNVYWSQFYQGMMGDSGGKLLIVDLTDASVTELGVMGLSGCMVTGLHTKPAQVPAIGKPDVTGVMVNASALLRPGETVKLSASLTPVSVSLAGETLTFTSSAPDVATVSADGAVTGVAGGTAVITVSYGEFSATCTVNVVGEETRLYVASPNALTSYPLLNPGEQGESVCDLSDIESGLVTAAYNEKDGYFYGIDSEGWLWKFTASGETQKIGDIPFTQALSDMDAYSEDAIIEVRDIDFLDGTLYALVYSEDPVTWDVRYSFYTVDLATGAGTFAYTVALDTVEGGLDPLMFTFYDGSKYVVYDQFTDTVYVSELGSSENDMVSWVGDVSFISDSSNALVYSADLGMIFVCNGSELLMMDLADGSHQILGNVAYTDLADMFIVTGDIAESLS